jgi:hypothetical protein
MSRPKRTKPKPAAPFLGNSDGGALTLKERLARGQEVSVDETMVAGLRHIRLLNTRMLDRYQARGEVTERQYGAGDRLYRTWFASGSSPIIIGAYSIRVDYAGHDLTDHQATMRAAVTGALQAVPFRMAQIIVSVVFLDEPANAWGRQQGNTRDGIACLRLSLDILGDHYRIPQNVVD